MKRILLFVGLLSLLAVASACGGGDEKTVTLPGDNGNVKVSSGDKLPSDFPDDFPIFKDAKLTGSVSGEQEGQSGYFVSWETDASADDVTSFYKEALDNDPWQTAGVFSSGEGSVISFARTDGKDLGGGVTVASSDGKTQISVFLGEGTGIVPTEEATPEEEATPAEGTTSESTPAQAELPEEAQLPNGYPTDVAPIPDGAHVTDASSYTSGGNTSYAITFVTEDDPQSVADFYSSQVPGNGWSEASQGSASGQIFASYQNEAEGGDLVLTVGPSDNYEGYTEANIILSIGQQ
jgi:hypothetical protein